MAEKLKALGIISGIGSMLIGARAAGFEVVGNIEDRKYYHTGTFEHNFEGAYMVKDISELEEIPQDITLIMGHADCGDFSNLNTHRKKTVERGAGCAHIKKTVEWTQKIKPRYFAFDNLPRSLEQFGAQEWYDAFPDYDIFFEWISNWGYGNVQKNRDRLFVIGAKKEENFTFIPSEYNNPIRVKDLIQDLIGKEGTLTNHPHFIPEQKIGYFKDFLKRGETPTLSEFIEAYQDHPSGKAFTYLNKDGEIKTRIGMMKTHWEKTCHVLTKELPVLHPTLTRPLTIRERARVQGVPDDFEFIGQVFNDKGELDYHKSIKLSYQTGKCMPVQFNEYLSKLIMANINGEKIASTCQRVLKENKIVTEHKIKMCELNHKKEHCEHCWCKDRCRLRYHTDFFDK